MRDALLSRREERREERRAELGRRGSEKVEFMEVAL